MYNNSKMIIKAKAMWVLLRQNLQWVKRLHFFFFLIVKKVLTYGKKSNY